MSQDKLLRVHDPPLWQQEGEAGGSMQANNAVWMAHEVCADVIPETWVDEIEVGDPREDGSRAKERVVFGVDAIVKDRWNLVRQHRLPFTWGLVAHRILAEVFGMHEDAI